MNKKILTASIIGVVVGDAAIFVACLLSAQAGLPDFAKGFIEGFAAVVITIGVFGIIKSLVSRGKNKS